MFAETAAHTGGFLPCVASPVWKNGYKGHVPRRSCPTDRTDPGTGGCWRLRTTLKL